MEDDISTHFIQWNHNESTAVPFLEQIWTSILSNKVTH